MVLFAVAETAAILQAQGHASEAVTLIEKGIHEGGVWSGAEHWYMLAAARALVGDAPGARRDLARADDMIDAQQPNFTQSIERLKAEINLDLLEAQYISAAEKYSSLARKYYVSEYRWCYAWTLRDWANAYLKANQMDTARDLLVQAAAEFETMEIPIYAGQIRQQLAEINSPNS